MSTGKAYLTGTLRCPAVALYFDRNAVHPGNHEPMSAWVKKAPGRRWDPRRGCWLLTAFGAGKDPEALLARAGFELDLTGGVPGEGLDPSLSDVFDLRDLIAPMAKASTVTPNIALVRPRFLGWHGTRDILGPGARWDKETERFEVPLADILRHGDVKEGLLVDPATETSARELVMSGPRVTVATDVLDEARAAAAGTGEGDGHDESVIDRLVDVVGDIPAWLGMTPRPYQRLGSLAMIAGHSLLCDPTGLGKSLQIIAALAVQNVDRAVIVAPPVVITHWAREVERCHLAYVPPKPPRKTKPKKGASPPAPAPLPPGFRPEAGSLAVFRAGRKEPELPERGIAIVPDSLLAARSALLAKLIAWAPQAVAYDEAHRAKTWTSTRATAMRALFESLPPQALRIASTATPVFASPHELASLLALTGHLDWVFGGYDQMLADYTKRNRFNQIVPRLDQLPELQDKLREHVWVRRKKALVLKDLPSKSRFPLHVDVDLAGFRAAHNAVIDTVGDWLDQFHTVMGRPPEDDEIHKWCRAQIGLMSPLRKAAGLAKVPVAIDHVGAWIEENVQINADGTFTCDQPLLVWAHHHEVVEALVAAAKEKTQHVKGGKLVDVIDGSTSTTRRGEIADRFQAGQIAVLICSIQAAGVGLTLTRGSDALFVESDFNVSAVSQAEDRLHRIGQENHVMIRVLVAEGTFDSRIQEILARKATIVGAITGDVDDVSVETTDPGLSPAQILFEIATAVLRTWRPHKVSPAA